LVLNSAPRKLAISRIVIVGVGAIGSVIGAALIQSRRHDVTLCVRSATFEKLVIRRRDGVLEVPATPIVNEQDARPVEWLMLCTKAHQSASAARKAPGLMIRRRIKSSSGWLARKHRIPTPRSDAVYALLGAASGVSPSPT